MEMEMVMSCMLRVLTRCFGIGQAHGEGEDEDILPSYSTPNRQVQAPLDPHSLYLVPSTPAVSLSNAASAIPSPPPSPSPSQSPHPNFRFSFHVIQINNHFETPQAIGSPLDLRKTFLSLTYQGVINFVVFALPKSSPSSTLIHIVEVSLVVGFSASFSAILLQQAYPEIAVVLEKAGYVFAASGVFLMMSLVLPPVPVSVGCVCGGYTLVAFLLHIRRA